MKETIALFLFLGLAFSQLLLDPSGTIYITPLQNTSSIQFRGSLRVQNEDGTQGITFSQSYFNSMRDKLQRAQNILEMVYIDSRKYQMWSDLRLPVDAQLFTIGNTPYLVVAQLALESKLYSWNNATGLFSLVQNFPAINAEGVEVFAFGGNTYLVFADYAGTGVSTVIYRWSGSQFVEFQSIAHSGIFSNVQDWKYIQVTGGLTHYLIAGTDRSAAYFGWNSGTQRFELSAGSPFLEKFTRVVHPFNIGMTPLLALGGNAQVDIYRRSGSTFAFYYNISGFNDVSGLASFEINDALYLAISDLGAAAKLYRIVDSTVELVQTFDILRSQRVHYFEVKGQRFLIFGTLDNAATKLYRWNARIQEFDVLSSLADGVVTPCWNSHTWNNKSWLFGCATVPAASYLYELL